MYVCDIVFPVVMLVLFPSPKFQYQLTPGAAAKVDVKLTAVPVHKLPAKPKAVTGRAVIVTSLLMVSLTQPNTDVVTSEIVYGPAAR